MFDLVKTVKWVSGSTMFETMFADTMTCPVEEDKVLTCSVYDAKDLAIPMT